MKEIIITSNDAGRRLDRFLRKYLRNASLAGIYKLIRKDVKVNGKRKDEAYMLSEGDVLTLYIAEEELAKMTAVTPDKLRHKRARKQFEIVYEDANILIANKPFGLLTHGDCNEKKNHLANQVKDYLIETGQYNSAEEKVFSPAPANRIDRNTTGIVVFGKTSSALKTLNQMIRDDMVSKKYLTIVHGRISHSMDLRGSLVKDEQKNKVAVSDGEGLEIRTIVRPLQNLDCNTTLVEVELITGRSHQIRAHLASIGHPIIGDGKYQTKQSRSINKEIEDRFRLSTQLLHAYRLGFKENASELDYLGGREFIAEVPDTFKRILKELGGERRSGNGDGRI